MVMRTKVIDNVLPHYCNAIVVIQANETIKSTCALTWVISPFYSDFDTSSVPHSLCNPCGYLWTNINQHNVNNQTGHTTRFPDLRPLMSGRMSNRRYFVGEHKTRI